MFGGKLSGVHFEIIFFAGVDFVIVQHGAIPLVEEQPCFSGLTSKVFVEFLECGFDPNDREYPDDRDQITEILLKKNYLSTKDIEVCLKYDMNSISSNPRFDQIQQLFNTFKTLYEGQLE